MNNVAAVLMMLMGITIAGVWTREILAGDKVDLSHGFFAARDPDAGTLFWCHWLAEYVTAAALIVAAVGLLVHANWAAAIGGLATGALLYTSVNSLSGPFRSASGLAMRSKCLLASLLACCWPSTS